MILGITGTNYAGKGTAVEMLKKRGFSHYSVRGFLTEIIKERDLEVCRQNMIDIANELREANSPSYIVEKLYEKASRESEKSIIESIRCPGEAHALKKLENFYLLAIDSSSEIRYERGLKRDGISEVGTYIDFLEKEMVEWENEDPFKQNIKKCIELSDFKIIHEISFDDLEKRVSNVIDSLQ